MRLPFPERISLLYVVLFAGFLATVEVFEGTPGEFAICTFLFIVIAAIAFNLAGGFARPSGSYVFFYAVLGVIVGLTWKAVLGEPADSNLLMPLLTIHVYLGGIAAMLVAVYLGRKLTTKRAILGTVLKEADKQNATMGCMATGILITFIQLVLPHPDGSVMSAILQLNRFLVMAIVLGVTRQIMKSGGTSSVNLPVLLSFAFLFAAGVIGFSKEGMITPFVCWLVAACSLRYRISNYQLIGVILTGLFIFQFLVPYSQYGRNFMTPSISQNFDTSISLLSNLGYVREQYAMQEEETREEAVVSYYNSPQGFFDRLQMISVDDSLIEFTERRGTFGLSPLILSFENLAPHVFWHDKPAVGFGNVYAHEVGGLSEEDTTTGISFSPTGEAFHLARWTGVLIVAPILWTLLFTLFDSLCGDVRRAPWGLLIMVTFSHMAPEGMLGGVIYMFGYTTITIVVVALSVAYIMPVVGALMIGPGRVGLRRIAPIRSFPARRVSPDPNAGTIVS
jgi:hypothetical protein